MFRRIIVVILAIYLVFIGFDRFIDKTPEDHMKRVINEIQQGSIEVDNLSQKEIMEIKEFIEFISSLDVSHGKIVQGPLEITYSYRNVPGEKTAAEAMFRIHLYDALGHYTNDIYGRVIVNFVQTGLYRWEAIEVQNIIFDEEQLVLEVSNN